MQDEPQANPKKLFVGNLPWATTEDELRDLFSPHGEIIDLAVISDRRTGRSKGIAFVEYSAEEEAQAAIEALHGQDLGGRDLVVNVARPRQPRPNRGGYNNRRGGYGDRGGYGRRDDNRGGDRGGYNGGF